MQVPKAEVDDEVTIVGEMGTNCAKRIYSLKAINPNGMSDFKTITISGAEYSGLEKLKVFLSENKSQTSVELNWDISSLAMGSRGKKCGYVLTVI